METNNDDMTAYWRDVNAVKKEQRADNRARAPELLREAGIDFYSRNDGIHLIVIAGNDHIDFWPGRQKWRVRRTNKIYTGPTSALVAFIREQAERDRVEVLQSRLDDLAKPPCGGISHVSINYEEINP